MGLVAVPYLFVGGLCFSGCFRCLGGCVGLHGSRQFEGEGGGLAHSPGVGGSDHLCVIIVVRWFTIWVIRAICP